LAVSYIGTRELVECEVRQISAMMITMVIFSIPFNLYGVYIIIDIDKRMSFQSILSIILGDASKYRIQIMMIKMILLISINESFSLAHVEAEEDDVSVLDNVFFSLLNVFTLGFYS